MKATLLLALSLLLPQDAGSSAAGLDELRAIPVLDLAGHELTLGAAVDGPGGPRKAPLAIAYTSVGCPIAQKYAGRLTRVAERYGQRGVRFVAVNASPGDTREKIAKEAEELDFGLTVFKDFRQELTAKLGVKTTTEVLLFDGEGRLFYRGAVDDQYTLGAAKPVPTANYLTDALDALLGDGEPDVERTDAPGCLITRLPEHELPEAITYSKHVSRILRDRCVSCHRPGQVGPFSLETYDDARNWARMMRLVVNEDRMPPWNATERYDGVFANERRLRADEKAELLAWIENGMPRGNPAEDAPPRTWPEGWTIGEPDLVLAMETSLRSRTTLPPEGYRVPREGVVNYQYFTVETDFPEDRWIQAIEARAGAPEVVHHILVLTDQPEKGRTVFSSTDAFKSYLAVGVPGDLATRYPEGYGKRLPAGARLVFQMHYTPNGKEYFDRSEIGIVFCDEPPEFEVVTDAVVNNEFLIPAGAGHHEVRATMRLEKDTGLVALFPHMHTRGKDFRYLVHYPDGETEELLAVDYDFNWQEAYVLPDPLLLPSGTRLECIGHFDNSMANPNNPDPSQDVEWGDQTFEEMFIGYFDSVRPVGAE